MHFFMVMNNLIPFEIFNDLIKEIKVYPFEIFSDLMNEI
jgi:virulence-associated protein VapD